MDPSIKELSVIRTEFAQLDRHCPHLPYVELEVPKDATEVLEVAFIFASRDQGSEVLAYARGVKIIDTNNSGWASSNSFSYTWFEATTKRPDGRSDQPIMVIAPNRAANPEFFQNRVIFVSKSTRPQGPWVRGILARDVIQVIPKAAYPGWVNIIKEYQIKIKYKAADLPPLQTLMLSGTNAGHYAGRLDSHSQEIRLLIVKPGKFEDPIKGSFTRVKLAYKNIPLEYHALSYCWGDASDRVDIYMTESKGETSTSPSKTETAFSITRSAYTALRRLRHNEKSIKIWVDAICINQYDMVERSQQVRLMGTIYSSATAVNIWLGETQPGVTEAFQVIRDTYNFNHGSCPAGDECQCFGTRHLLKSDQVTEAMERNKQGPGIPVLCGMREVFRLTANTFEGDIVYFAGGPGRMELSKLMERLFYNPWFTRVWVIQEALLASKAQVHFAGEMVPWEELVLMSEALEDPNFTVQHIQTRQVMAPIWKSMKRQGQLETPKREGILDVVLEGLDMKATDARDRLFALLTFGEETHMAHDLDDLIRPNYDKPVARVFADFTRWWIKTHKSLSILSAVHSQYGRTWRRTLARHQETPAINQPSWAIHGDGRSKWSKANLDAQFEFRATGGSEPDMALLSSSEPLVLRLRGKRVSAITEITYFPSQSMAPYKKGTNSQEDMSNIFDRMMDACGFYGFWGSKSIQQSSEITADRAQNEHWTHINSHLHYSEEAILKRPAPPRRCHGSE